MDDYLRSFMECIDFRCNSGEDVVNVFDGEDVDGFVIKVEKDESSEVKIINCEEQFFGEYLLILDELLVNGEECFD